VRTIDVELVIGDPRLRQAFLEGSRRTRGDGSGAA
jgi:hypothetical protein